VPQSQFEIEVIANGAPPSLPISVDDVDGNLNNIRVDISPLPRGIFFGPDFADKDPSPIFDRELTESGFIITGTQENLVPVIRDAFFVVPDEAGSINYTVTVTSTDSEGAIDTDTFEINLTVVDKGY